MYMTLRWFGPVDPIPVGYVRPANGITLCTGSLGADPEGLRDALVCEPVAG